MDTDSGEVRLSRHRAKAGELGRLDGDFVVPLRLRIRHHLEGLGGLRGHPLTSADFGLRNAEWRTRRSRDAYHWQPRRRRYSAFRNPQSAMGSAFAVVVDAPEALDEALDAGLVELLELVDLAPGGEDDALAYIGT